jgi:hypothetical protein
MIEVPTEGVCTLVEQQCIIVMDNIISASERAREICKMRIKINVQAILDTNYLESQFFMEI